MVRSAHVLDDSNTIGALHWHYIDYSTLSQGLVQMLADVHRVDITDDDVRSVKRGMLTMPAHSDVEDGLTALRDSLTALENAGWPTSSSSSSVSIPAAHSNPRRLSTDMCARRSTRHRRTA